MLKFYPQTKEAVTYLRKVLDSLVYDFTLRGEPYIFSAAVNACEFHELMKTLPEANRICYNLFLFGKTAAYEETTELLGKETTDTLIKMELLKDIGEGIKTNGYSILPSRGCYFLTGTAADSLSGYAGGMNLFNAELNELFSPYLPSAEKDRALELNTNLGSRVILNSLHSGKGIAVINKQATAKFNILLNGLENKIEIREDEDSFVIPAHEKFNMIYIHLPYHLEKNEGLNNLKNLCCKLDRISGNLSLDGKIVISGQTAGQENHPFLPADLKSLAETHRWNIRIVLENKISAGMFTYLAAEAAVKAGNLKRTPEQKTLAECVYFFTMYIKKTDATPKIDIFNLCNTWNKNNIPRLKEGIEFQPGQSMYLVVKHGKILAEVDEETLDFLKMCDGKQTLSELAKDCAVKHQKESSFEIEKAIAETLGVCRFLKREGVLK